jgi:hypothetical protein
MGNKELFEKILKILHRFEIMEIDSVEAAGDILSLIEQPGYVLLQGDEKGLLTRNSLCDINCHSDYDTCDSKEDCGLYEYADMIMKAQKALTESNMQKMHKAEIEGIWEWIRHKSHVWEANTLNRVYKNSPSYKMITMEIKEEEFEAFKQRTLEEK